MLCLVARSDSVTALETGARVTTMTDEVIDLSAPAQDDGTKLEVKNAQFVRDLSHILIPETEEGETPVGPLIVLGPYNLQFKERAPVNALGHLIEGGLEGMRKYILGSLEDSAKPDFEKVQDRIDIDGLGEILNALGEGYTNFQEKS